jgi:general L-amino acid transport system substrate-binding protein
LAVLNTVFPNRDRIAKTSETKQRGIKRLMFSHPNYYASPPIQVWISSVAGRIRKDGEDKQFMMYRILTACILLLAAVLNPATARAGETLTRVRANGVVRCGVSEGLPGFSVKDAAGHWQGFSVDFCRALAATVLGNADKVVFIPVTAASRFPVLLSGKIDLLMRNTTYTFDREAAIGVHFAGIYYYDGQAFMVPHSSGVRSIAGLNGATICIEKGTTHEANLVDYFHQQGMTHKPLVIETLPGVTAAFFAGQCQAYTSDRSQLAAVRTMAPGGLNEYNILPEIISKEPLGPVVRRGDEEWLTLVKWVLFALIEAEERGVTQATARALRDTSTDPGLCQFLRSSGLPEKALGISPGWVVRVVETVGNYGEFFERHLGSQSGLKLERGLNRLWTQEGLMYAPSFR